MITPLLDICGHAGLLNGFRCSEKLRQAAISKILDSHSVSPFNPPPNSIEDSPRTESGMRGEECPHLSKPEERSMKKHLRNMCIIRSGSAAQLLALQPR